MKKSIKYSIAIIILAIAVYNSIYVQSLEEKLAENKVVLFDANAYVNKIWNNELLPVFNESTNLISLLDQLKKDPKNTFKNKAQALGIGNIGYFKVKGTGTVLQVKENNVLLKVENQIVEIETEFIFGNAIRDASGLIKINDYKETSDFNSISEAINNKIREEVIPDFKRKVKKGDVLAFTGAIELNKVHLNLNQLEIIPISLEIKE